MRMRAWIVHQLRQRPESAKPTACCIATYRHFAKAFRDTTGLAPHRYVTERRLLAARTLLHDQRLSVGAIATAVGFTHSSFTRLFTRHMGMTPTAFRELLQC